jgi:predicted metal-dependent hydrolase
MKVRHPELDFTGLPAHWADNVEVTQSLNAIGIVPAHIEPYLIKVLRQARERLDPLQHPDLIHDIDTFIKQEAQHLKLHSNLNKVIRDDGYEGMLAFEEAYAADYARFLSKKSLQWNMAYCEGFEALGSSVAQGMVDGIVFESLGQADPRPVELWKWHLAEEYEHRDVAFRTYHALYGHHPVRAWLYRVYGFFTAGRHIGSHVTKVYTYLRRTDGSTEKRPQPVLKSSPGSLKSLLAVLSPFYDPARLPPPKHLEQVLAQY